jgi:hypothetical protein
MPDNGFDKWLESQAGASLTAGPGPSWLSWPDKAKQEIEQVLKHNDEGNPPITMRSMLVRMREVHGIQIRSASTLTRYVRETLGRGSWSVR